MGSKKMENNYITRTVHYKLVCIIKMKLSKFITSLSSIRTRITIFFLSTLIILVIIGSYSVLSYRNSYIKAVEIRTNTHTMFDYIQGTKLAFGIQLSA